MLASNLKVGADSVFPDNTSCSLFWGLMVKFTLLLCPLLYFSLYLMSLILAPNNQLDPYSFFRLYLVSLVVLPVVFYIPKFFEVRNREVFNRRELTINCTDYAIFRDARTRMMRWSGAGTKVGERLYAASLLLRKFLTSVSSTPVNR